MPILSTEPPPQVTVLLALRNGAAFLEPQLASLVGQSQKPALILASDDGSTDATPAIFRKFAATLPEGAARLVDGPARGGTANFLHLLALAPAGQLTAFCDQDDVWLPEKLARAARALQGIAGPALYGARSFEVDAALKHPRLSRPMPPPWDFGHALAQNFAGGNTMVLNAAALTLVQRCLPGLPEPVVHDWFLYQLIAGAGGRIVFDDTPVLLYRQHPGNMIGAAGGLGAKLQRAAAMLTGTYSDWSDRNIASLRHCQAALTPAARALLDDFAQNRHAPLPTRLNMLRRTRLHRKGVLNQAGLWLAAILNRI
jgi:glycosyltransferase involved in cell wall biosynthesis